MKKNTIWRSEINMDDWTDFLNDEYPDVDDDVRQRELVQDLNDSYRDDEVLNLNIPLEGDVIIIASLGLWNGRVPGYRYVTANVNACVNTDHDVDELYVFADAHNVRADAAHHDGVNHYLFRELKPGVDRDNPLTRAIANGYEPTSDQISRYTRSLRPHVAKVYGW